MERIIKNYNETIKLFLSITQTSLIIYLVYKINKTQVEMLETVTRANTNLREKMELFNSKFIESINSNNSAQVKMLEKAQKTNAKIDGKLEAINSKMKSLDLSFIESMNNNNNNSIRFKESNEVVLKMLELQNKVAAESSVPAINIVNESYTKPVVIGAFVLVALTAACVWWLTPKVLLITVTQLEKLNYIVSEISRFLPGSNSAEGITVLTKLGIRIVTKITKGTPELTVLKLDDTAMSLEAYILELISRGVVESGANVIEIVGTVSNSGIYMGIL